MKVLESTFMPKKRIRKRYFKKYCVSNYKINKTYFSESLLDN